MTPRMLAVVFCIWSIPIVMGIAQYAFLSSYGQPLPYSFKASIITQVPFWWFWAAITPVVFAARRRFQLRRGLLLRSGPVHLLLVAAITLAHTCVTYAAIYAAGTIPPSEPFLVTMNSALARLSYLDIILYGIVVGAGTTLELRLVYAQQRVHAATLEAQVADARLRALRMQLNPHFLFNTLNSVAMLIRARANPEALKVVVTLSDLLRYVLSTDAQEVRLADELAFLQEYLEIEKVRFQDRLQVRITADASAQAASVPSLVLQPLVENAIRHGIAAQMGEGRIEVTATRVGDFLELTVRDNGPGLAPGAARGLGLGLQNTRARLTELYRGRGTLAVTREAEWTVVRVRIPFASPNS